MDDIEIENLIDKATSGQCLKEELVSAQKSIEAKISASKTNYTNNYPKEWEEVAEIFGPIDNAKEIERLEYYADKISKLLDKYKNFNKYVCFNNIRALLKTKTDVKIGMIEKAAGVRIGYMSRLEKIENTTEPSIEFIATAAKMLDVSIDFLISEKIEEVTPTEEYVLKFLKYVNDDTECGKLYWHRQPNKILNNPTNLFFNYEQECHPLQTYDEKTKNIASFHSFFYEEDHVIVADNIYWAKLENTDSDIYIFPCCIEDRDENPDASVISYEIYMVTQENSIIPLCNTLKACDKVGKAVKDLYTHIEIVLSHVNIDDKAKSVIDAYMKKKEELPNIKNK